MNDAPPFWRTCADGIEIRTHIQPRASRNEVCGLHDGALKLRITAPPLEGKANGEIINLLAKRLKLPKTGITIRQGHRGRTKLIHLACPRPKQPAVIRDLEGMLPKTDKIS